MTGHAELKDPARWTFTILPSPNGDWVAGRPGRTGGQRAALWPKDGSRVIVLGDDIPITEAMKRRYLG